MSLPHVSAVVLNYKEYEKTIECAQGILRQSYPSISVVVVDNASPDGSHARLTAAFASRQDVSVVTADRNGGYACGNNFGARWAITHSSPQYILIVNPDIELVEPTTVESLVAFAEEHKDAAVVGPKVVLPSGRIQGPYDRPSLMWLCAQYLCPALWLALRSWRQRRIGSIGIASRCFRTIGACMLIRAQDFEAVGMFDEETFLYYEEDILAERLLTLRKTFYYLPTVRVIHHHKRNDPRKWTLDSACHYFSRYRGAGPLRLAALRASYKLYRNVFCAAGKAAARVGNAQTAEWE